MATEEASYKDLQRSFVSNLNGTTVLEISVVTSYTPLSILLRSLLWCIVFEKNGSSHSSRLTSVVFIVEYVSLMLPTLLAFTLLANYAFIGLLLLLFITMFTAVRRLCLELSRKDLELFQFTDNQKPFLCNFRAFVNIATAISILAVDFVIYPRRFAKTETFGTGLMDVGVGSFIISNAVVSREARGKTASSPSLLTSVQKELKSVSILLGLGFMRFIAVKSTDYQEHVSEYGVHWNFFLTLVFVRVFSTIILGVIPRFLRDRPWIVGLCIGVLYHYFLANGLEGFVLNGSRGDGSRSDFIDANREGICSCVGYMALYFLGVGIGQLIFRERHKSLTSAVKLLLWLAIIASFTWLLLSYWTKNVGMISRRLANFPFVLWQVAYNVQLLAMFLIVDILMVGSGSKNTSLQHPGGCMVCLGVKRDTETIRENVHSTDVSNSTSGSSATINSVINSKRGTPREVPGTKHGQTCLCLITAVNFNQLGYFLIANLLTGAVNLCFETINASPLTAFVVLNAYLLALSGIITFLYRRKVLLKF